MCERGWVEEERVRVWGVGEGVRRRVRVWGGE